MYLILSIFGVSLLIAAGSITHCHDFMCDGHLVKQADHPYLFWTVVTMLGISGLAVLGVCAA